MGYIYGKHELNRSNRRGMDTTKTFERPDWRRPFTIGFKIIHATNIFGVSSMKIRFWEHGEKVMAQIDSQTTPLIYRLVAAKQIQDEIFFEIQIRCWGHIFTQGVVKIMTNAIHIHLIWLWDLSWMKGNWDIDYSWFQYDVVVNVSCEMVHDLDTEISRYPSNLPSKTGMTKCIRHASGTKTCISQNNPQHPV